MTYAPVKFEVNTFNGYGGDEFSRKYNCTLFDRDSKVKVTQNFAQFPLHYVIYTPAKFATASSKGSGGESFTRNLMDRPIHGRTDGPTW